MLPPSGPEQNAGGPGSQDIWDEAAASLQPPGSGAKQCHHDPIARNIRDSAQPFSYKPKEFLHPGPLCTHHTAPSLQHPRTAQTHLKKDGDWEKDTNLFQVKACDASTGVTR